MKIGVYFCCCGTNISSIIDPEKVRATIESASEDIHFCTFDFLCSEEGKEFLAHDILANHVDRAVICACSPRDHEDTFMGVLRGIGINPYLMQMVNLREHIAWVTGDGNAAVKKASAYIRSALGRVSLHEPLREARIEICPDVLIIGAGPAGLKAALSIAQTGRKVTIVEKTPVIGGLPVRYEEIFPNMECGPCMLEPMLGEVIHGKHSNNIELFTLSEVVDTLGYLGNFRVKILKRPRRVDSKRCVGCSECIDACPSMKENEFNYAMNQRKAIDTPFPGSIPNVPFIDDTICLKMLGKDCNACVEACPIGDELFAFDEREEIIERRAGAIIVAIGASLYDCRAVPRLGYGKVKDIYSSLEFERILASNGPYGGEIRLSDGRNPQSAAIIHCVGSLDRDHREYCSGICCQYAFKFNDAMRKSLGAIKIYHLYKELVIPGKDSYALYRHAVDADNTTLLRYRDIKNLKIDEVDGGMVIKHTGSSDDAVKVDMVILCPPVVPAEASERLANILEAQQDRFGFFAGLHSSIDSVQSSMLGVYHAGACQSPMDIKQAINQGLAAAGYALSVLVEGRMIDVLPLIAVIDEERCSGCKVCIMLCPYKAIGFDPEKAVSKIEEVLCKGCGTCAAACPSGAIRANHFTSNEITAEIEALI